MKKKSRTIKVWNHVFEEKNEISQHHPTSWELILPILKCTGLKLSAEMEKNLDYLIVSI